MAEMVKLLMAWDIKPGHEQEYFEFIVREFAPGMMRLGMEPTDAWYTMYGEGPQILTGAIAQDMETLQRILASPEWQDLKKKLFRHIRNYKEKIVKATGRFQVI
ncbi:hypothetical protein [Thermoflexus sp.]|uniref:hypothetical protein n=1 Tax=Thermoflexus sp. TaxID=1969742 RepID=UPI0025CDF277|nr:hypothetical protein [Thermoflexus sp.]MDW8179854.1 hypothetical protein [Anaerolineae bacterium]MCS6963461.1 hypothetical protein [Thermoflexus sp.]MCS7350403.1 hypothetical protein [Thermoflexus sp.]MCX7689949.1 hypothetical protein [Thermoflexus sp.]MDW8184164.1 hypothetical protein [Anaerolineae bacterium]